MARVFAYLMSNDLKELTDEGIFSDTSDIIREAIANTQKLNPNKTGLAKAALGHALKQLV
jgi:Arc/MetJ-type ribon-helix-helix transcriptional regulator